MAAAQQVTTTTRKRGIGKTGLPWGTKGTKGELIKRRNAVYLGVVMGSGASQIQQALGEGGFGEVPLRTVEDDMAWARHQLEDELKAQRLTLKARQRARITMSIRNLIAAGKYGETAPLERILAQIEGNFAPVQIEVIKTGWESLTDEELAYMRNNPGKLPPGRTLEELEHVT